MKNKMKVYRSRIDSNFIVSIFYQEHEFYNTIKLEFSKYGIAILDILRNVIAIDGEAIKSLTRDHIYFIEAHEIAHSKLNHSYPLNAKDETAADFGALILCKHAQLLNAYNIGIDEFYNRNHVNVKTYSKLYGHNILKQLKLGSALLELI